MIKMNIIGAGRLGKTLGYLLSKHKLVVLNGICNTTLQSAIQATQYMAGGTAYASPMVMPEADLTLIATSDNVIDDMSQLYANNPFLKKGSIVFHCSGVLTSDCLYALKEKGCFVASIHPMHSFADPIENKPHFKDVYCAFEGDDEAINVIVPLFTAIKGICYPIKKDKKELYHVASVFASNYLVTLCQEAFSYMQHAAIPDDIAFSAILQLMEGSLANLAQTTSPQKALTGPIHRGDVSVLLRHMDAIKVNEKRLLYAILGKATMSLTSHDPALKAALANAFDQV